VDLGGCRVRPCAAPPAECGWEKPASPIPYGVAMNLQLVVARPFLPVQQSPLTRREAAAKGAMSPGKHSKCGVTSVFQGSVLFDKTVGLRSEGGDIPP